VIRSQEAEFAEDWEEGKEETPPVDDYYGEEVIVDLEDTMTEEEWLIFYDENLAQSDINDEVLNELEEMQDDLEAGKKIDMTWE
jgi:hypothetical protein